MSKREMAHKILDNLNDEQLTGFIALFGIFHIDSDKEEKEKAYEELTQIIKPIQNLDEKKELKDYREGKYLI